jgi:hypothetical protein
MNALGNPTQKYLRAALSNQYNLILFAGSVSFSAALASWAPLLSGLFGEAVWLLTGPRLPSFRRRTDALEDKAGSVRILEALGPEYAQRVAILERDVSEIDELCASRADVSAEQAADVLQRLRPMVQSFLEVCSTHQRLRRVAVQAPLAELQAELSTLHQALASETDLGVRASLRRALSVAERRIKQLESNEAAARSIELALQTLHKSVALFKEAAAGLGTVVELCAEIDAATAQLGRAAALHAEREHEVSMGRPSSLPPPMS